MMVTRAQTARIITMFGYSMMGVSLIIATILPVCGVSLRYFPNNTAPAKLLPFQIHYVYDTMESPQYEFTYVLQVISMFLSILSYTGVDNFFGLLVFHICGQLDILRHRIMHLNKYTDYADILKRCVMEHTRLFRYSSFGYILHIDTFLSADINRYQYGDICDEINYRSYGFMALLWPYVTFHEELLYVESYYFRAIIIIEDTFNVMLLVLFLYFGIFLTSYGFLILSVSKEQRK